CTVFTIFGVVTTSGPNSLDVW
nr:immunoglobulin heavy chain junction region [Macaca mulatta]MOW98339.1 immunoglobulin heavy chain junction region [Macaca mulatta]MOW98444.1 immunoglobulin heavy chain junction region [Macaca mulatta]MOW99136.1 immunoglobulin heavy chain junction region [Macaca mulatta]MOW99208.1 immunoglobulin heavy chain junction region [Macaca mulatta]